METLIKCLDRAGQESEALDVRKQIVDEWKDRFKVLKENSADDYDITDAPDNLADALDDLADFYSEHERAVDEMKTRKEIVGIQKNRLQQFKKISADDDEKICALENVIDALNDAGDSDEELRYRLELVNFCKEKFPNPTTRSVF